MDFESYLKKNPEMRFSDYYVYKLKTILNAGVSHGALGKDLSSKTGLVDFEEAGRPEFERYVKQFSLKPEHRVVDFGCGSLRLGIHFIRYLNPGNYFGLDLTDDFIISGLERVQERLGDNWDAQIGTISDRFDDAVKFSADFVVSSNVAYHVHPNECAQYYEQLGQLAGQRDAFLCFDSRVSNEEQRFGDRNWAFPLQSYIDSLPDMELVNTIPALDELDQIVEEREIVRVIFHFARK